MKTKFGSKCFISNAFTSDVIFELRRVNISVNEAPELRSAFKINHKSQAENQTSGG